MKCVFKVGIAVAAVALTSLSAVTASTAGGLYERTSVKDGPAAYHSGAGRCYLRGDVGYSYSGDPDSTSDSPLYGTVENTGVDMDGAFMGEIGIGCGSGSRGFRADFTLGYRGDRDVDGHKSDVPGFHFPATFETQVSTLTAMANLYYDFGMIRNFVPYVGVGFGVARHDLDDVSFTGVGAGVGAPFNNLRGSDETNFAWSLMAGAAYQISERAVLDFGYRYIDMGDVSTARGDICSTSCGTGSRDKLSVDDITAHEFKIGLRYHFGHSAPKYESFK